MITNNGFLIVEFIDGLQIIPEIWFNANEQSCIWPSKFKTKFRINKAIMTCEMPQEPSTWDYLSVKRVFGKADTYSNALEKLVHAEETSHIDDTGMSSDERRQQRKKIRRMKAKKTWSSSSEYSDKDLYLDNDKENRTIQHNNVIVKKVPAYPKLKHFVSTSQMFNPTDISLQRPQNVIQKLTSADVMNITDKSINRTIDIHDKGELFIEECTGHIERQNFCDKNTNKNLVTNDKEHLTENSTRNIERENIFDNEFKKHILSKINKVLYKLDIMENRICMLDEKIQFSNCFIEECDFQFPISTLSELTHFEKQLQETKFKNGVINAFKLVGGTTGHAMIRNILKKSITNMLATYFSWAGKKKKRSFKDLSLATILTQAVRTIHNHMTDNDIAEYTSKWLAQATLRIHREKHSTPHDEKDDQQ